jgi:hypothetical protein
MKSCCKVAPTTFSQGLRDELDYLIELENEASAEDGEAAVTGDSAIYAALRRIDERDPGYRELDRADRLAIYDWLLEKGAYAVVTDAELACRAYFPRPPKFTRHRGQRIEWVKHL